MPHQHYLSHTGASTSVLLQTQESQTDSLSVQVPRGLLKDWSIIQSDSEATNRSSVCTGAEGFAEGLEHHTVRGKCSRARAAPRAAPSASADLHPAGQGPPEQPHCL